MGRSFVVRLTFLVIVSTLESSWATSDCFSNKKFNDEHRLTKLETAIKELEANNLRLERSNMAIQAELAATRNVFQNCISSQQKHTWALKRVDYIFPSPTKVQLHQKTITYTEKMPKELLPKNTRAIIISVFCNFWNDGGHAFMDVAINQKGSEDSGKAKVYNTHYQVHANNFYYEVMVPWDGDKSDEAVFKLTNTYNTGSHKGNNVNWYQVKLVGVISQ